MKKSTIALSIAALVAVTASAAFIAGRALATGAPAQTPLVWSGTVTDQSGKPYANSVDVTVSLFDQANRGAAKCVSAKVQAEVTGRFSVVLPAGCADAVHAAPDLWSELAVGANQSILPRVHVGAMPYALEADSASVAATAKNVNCVGCVKVDAMKFDKDVDTQGFTVTAGKLSTGVAGVNLTTGQLDLGPGNGDELTSAHVKTLTGGGNADALHTHAGGGGGGQVIKFKGVTSKTFDGGQGLAAMQAQCNKDFANSRVCTSAVLDELYPWPLPASQAWFLADGNWVNGTVTVQGLGYQQAQVNCTNGSTGPFLKTYDPGNTKGLTLMPDGSFALAPCSVQIVFPAICCGP